MASALLNSFPLLHHVVEVIPHEHRLAIRHGSARHPVTLYLRWMEKRKTRCSARMIKRDAGPANQGRLRVQHHSTAWMRDAFTVSILPSSYAVSLIIV
jgi:hypothetical protein